MADDGQPLDREHYELMSNAGRCDICGKPIDMKSGDVLTTMESDGPPVDGISQEDVASAMADALRRSGTPEDHAAADAYEEQSGLKAHDRCIEKTAIPDMPTMENAEW